MTAAIARDAIYRRRRFQPEIIELCAGRPARSRRCESVAVKE
jgi:hypothetical protein